jgi:hypothetical protein
MVLAGRALALVLRFRPRVTVSRVPAHGYWMRRIGCYPVYEGVIGNRAVEITWR